MILAMRIFATVVICALSIGAMYLIFKTVQEEKDARRRKDDDQSD